MSKAAALRRERDELDREIAQAVTAAKSLSNRLKSAVDFDADANGKPLAAVDERTFIDAPGQGGVAISLMASEFAEKVTLVKRLRKRREYVLAALAETEE